MKLDEQRDIELLKKKEKIAEERARRNEALKQA